MAVPSKSFLASKWYQIDKEWATELVGLRMKVRGSFLIILEWLYWGRKETTFDGRIIKEYNHDKRRWLIQFDNNDNVQHMCYDTVIKYADKDAGTFRDYRLPKNPITPPEEAATHHNETFAMADKLDWAEIFEERNHPTIPDMTPIPFTGEREEFDVNITQEEINTMKDSK